MTAARSTSKWGRENPGAGFARHFPFTSSGDITAAMDGGTVSNVGATAAVTLTLPQAVAGLKYEILRASPYAINVAIQNGDYLGDGEAGEGWGRIGRGKSIFVCLVDGTWEAIGMTKDTSFYNLADFVKTGTTDFYDALVDCEAACYADNRAMWVPIRAGGYGISQSVSIRVPMVGPTWPVSGQLLSKAYFKPLMTDGTWVLTFPQRNGAYVDNIAVIHPSATVLGDIRNAKGFKFGSVGSTPEENYAVTRSVINVHTYGLAESMQLQGWLNHVTLLQNVCTLGFTGEYLNNCTLDIISEGCGKDFVVTNTPQGCVFTRLECETNEGTAASTIDSSADIEILKYKTEGTRGAYPWLAVGGTSQVDNLQIRSGTVGPVSAGTYPITLDRVNTARVGSYFANSSTSRRTVSTTANTRNYDPSGERLGAAYPFIAQGTVAAKSDNVRRGLRFAENFTPNPFRDGLRFGCKDVSKASTVGAANIVLSENTTTFLTGNSSTKILVTLADNYVHVDETYDDPWVAANAGCVLTVAGWYWLENVSTLDGESTPTIYPALYVIGNGTSPVAGATNQGYVLKAGWNFLHCTVTLPTDATELYVSHYLNRGGTNTAAGAYMLVDSTFICPGDCWEAIRDGRVLQSSLAMGRIENGKLFVRKTKSQTTTMVADTTQTYEAGDEVRYTDAAASASPGAHCTTGGVGGTATWSAFANTGSGVTTLP